MKKLLAASLLLPALAFGQSASYDTATHVLTAPVISIGGQTLYNLKVKIKDVEVISVDQTATTATPTPPANLLPPGTYVPAPTPVKENHCTAANFTTDIASKLQALKGLKVNDGMLEVVVGCRAYSETPYPANTHGTDGVTLTWPMPGTSGVTTASISDTSNGSQLVELSTYVYPGP